MKTNLKIYNADGELVSAERAFVLTIDENCGKMQRMYFFKTEEEAIAAAENRINEWNRKELLRAVQDGNYAPLQMYVTEEFCYRDEKGLLCQCYDEHGCPVNAIRDVWNSAARAKAILSLKEMTDAVDILDFEEQEALLAAIGTTDSEEAARVILATKRDFGIDDIARDLMNLDEMADFIVEENNDFDTRGIREILDREEASL